MRFHNVCQRLGCLIQHESEHQALSTYVDDGFVFRDHGFQSRAECGSGGGGLGDQLFFLNDGNGGQGCCAGQWCAAKRAGMISRLEDIRQFWSADHSADRIAAAQGFCYREGIRTHAVALEGKPISGTSHAALHFVAKHQQVVLVAQLAYAGHECFIGRNHAAFALDRFEKYGHGIIRNHGPYAVEIVVIDLVEAFRQGIESSADLFLSGCGGGCQGPAMEGVIHGDDLELFLLVSPDASQFDQAFVCLGA